LQDGKLPRDFQTTQTVQITAQQLLMYQQQVAIGIAAPNPNQIMLWMHDDDFKTPAFIASSDLFVVVFDLDDKESLKHVRLQIYPTLRQSNGTAPILLVGAKKELRDDPESEIISDEALNTVKFYLSTKHYMEVSTLDRETSSMTALGEYAIQIITGTLPQSKSRSKAEDMQKCAIM